jgi:hypothetical protein
VAGGVIGSKVIGDEAVCRVRVRVKDSGQTELTPRSRRMNGTAWIGVQVRALGSGSGSGSGLGSDSGSGSGSGSG